MDIPLKTKFLINGYEIRLVVTDEQWKQNCYLVTHLESGEQVIIDPGSKEHLIIKLIEENGSGKLKYILLTHAHFDHVGAAYAISNSFELPCIVQKNDSRLLRQSAMYALRFGGKQGTVPKNVLTFDQDIELILGGNLIKVLLTPGHTQGSVCYVFNGFVFTGDTLLYNHVGRVDLPGSNSLMLKSSVDLILKNLSGEIQIFGGHGTHWNIADANLWWEDANMSPPQHNMFIH